MSTTTERADFLMKVAEMPDLEEQIYDMVAYHTQRAIDADDMSLGCRIKGIATALNTSYFRISQRINTMRGVMSRRDPKDGRHLHWFTTE